MSGWSWMGLLMDDTKGRWCKNVLLRLGYVISPVAIHLHLLAGVQILYLHGLFLAISFLYFCECDSLLIQPPPLKHEKHPKSEASLRWRLNAATKTKVTNSISFPLIQQPKQVLSPASLGGTFVPCLSGSLKRVFEWLDPFMLFTKNTFKCFVFTGVKEMKIKKIKVP